VIHEKTLLSRTRKLLKRTRCSKIDKEYSQQQSKSAASLTAVGGRRLQSHSDVCSARQRRALRYLSDCLLRCCSCTCLGYSQSAKIPTALCLRMNLANVWSRILHQLFLFLGHPMPRPSPSPAPPTKMPTSTQGTRPAGH
jgi:hypothetical protein